MLTDWLTISEAAAYLKVTRNTLYRWCEAGRLRYYELESGGGRRFKREDLDQLLRPNRHEFLAEELGSLVQQAERGIATGEMLDSMRELADQARQWRGLDVYDPGTASWVRRADTLTSTRLFGEFATRAIALGHRVPLPAGDLKTSTRYSRCAHCGMELTVGVPTGTSGPLTVWGPALTTPCPSAEA